MRPNYPLLALTLLIGNRIVNSRTSWGSADQPTSKKGAPPPPPQPEGSGKKRTPTSAFDPAAGKDVYEPEKIIGQRLSKGVTTFNVKWVGWADKDNTWEPIEHLAGCEDMIAEFKEREKTRIAQLEAVAQAKHAEKAAAAAHALGARFFLRVRLLLGWKQPVTICGDRRARKLRGPWLWCQPWWWTIPLLVAASMTWVPSDRHQFGCL